jgi:hypothetical protein
VARLGEFSPIGQLFSLGSVLKITEGGHFLATFFHGTGNVLILTNHWLGYILGDFFTNPSGHPALYLSLVTKWCS